MRVSYSKIGCFNQCPYQYKLRYLDELKTYFNGEPANALIIGTALHTGIEKDVETAIVEYYSNYPVINDCNIEEAMKLEVVIPKCKSVLPNGEHEVMIMDNGMDFIGFMDLIVPIETDEEGIEWFDLYDFKYSNAVDSYLKSQQLHVYKFFFERTNPKKKIRNMYYLFAPKVSIRMKKDENTDTFRMRLRKELSDKEPKLVKVDFDLEMVRQFLKDIKKVRTATDYPKNPTRLCDWCDFQRYCESDGKEDIDIMTLPKNERLESHEGDFKKIWIYGLPFSGKTYLANQFPNVLMLNTDGNTKQVDAPRILIKDEVTVEGRITKRKFAWDVFKETIDELEKKQNDYQTIVIDLLEDMYEYCRLWSYDKLGIEHESDNSFKAWDYVRTEFLSTIRRLLNLDYNFILISHEDASRDITKKTGDKITSIKPNVGDKIALKIAGMVDVVARVINDEGHRTISFKTSEIVFGGGRLEIKEQEIPCTYRDLIEIYGVNPEVQPELPLNEEPKKDEPQTAEQKPVVETPEEPKKRTRRVKSEA